MFGRENMFEKRLAAVPPQLFTTDGTANGKLTLVNTGLFKVKQQVILFRTAAQPEVLEVKAIIDITTMYLGPLAQTIDKRSDLSAYTVANGSGIMANEQKRPTVPQEEVQRAVYEEEPVVAYRVIGVDQFGNTVNWSEDGLVPQEFDDVILTRDLDEDITQAEFYLRGQEVRDLELTYNVAKSLIRVRKVGP